MTGKTWQQDIHDLIDKIKDMLDDPTTKRPLTAIEERSELLFILTKLNGILYRYNNGITDD